MIRSLALIAIACSFILVISCTPDPAPTPPLTKAELIVGNWDFQQTDYYSGPINNLQYDSSSVFSEIDTLTFTNDGIFYQLHRSQDNDTALYEVQNDSLILYGDSISPQTVFFRGYIAELDQNEFLIQVERYPLSNGNYMAIYDHFLRVP